MSIDVVIVAYGSQETLATAIGSVIDDPTVAQVLVVDNQSPDASAETAERAGATVVTNSSNAGFGAGCNLGAGHGESQWILFLNPDAAMDGGSLPGLVGYASERGDVAVVGSEVRGPGGHPEPVRRRFPVWWRLFTEPGIGARWDERFYRRTADARGGPVDWVSASAILVRREAFEAVGGFDDSFFLYAEEIDLCARLQAAGWATHWIPGYPSFHRSGGSTGELSAAGKEEWARGYSHYIARHARRPALMRAALLVGLWGRVVVWAARGRRVDARKWRAAAKVIRTG
ncbi:MAG TPA: glycosyltransferase family 2 protein [Acidimicrobiales bacterium]|nr:glycosyltransferase family 2 protein [Acidimicrobiales bacterium]